ncbi:MAG: O-antigen ligase family protein [Oscillospiraceae bacterium]|nr:O-antigen ligase family protein [Oscillospiraceae bacterium]
MDNMIRNCFIARLISFFAVAFPGSIPGRVVAFCSRTYHDSVTRRAFVAFFSASPKIVYSKLYKLLLSLNTSLSKLGKALAPVVASSFILRSFRAVSSSNLIEQSLLFGSLKALGMKRLLIAAFALYLPLDVFIRDVLKISFLSSVWDEAFMLFCVAYIIFRICIAGEIKKPRITPVDMPLLFFTAIGLLLMAIVSPKIGPAVAGYRAVCQFMLWFFVLTRLIEDDKDFKTLYFTVCVMATAIALHGIYQYIVKAPMPAQWVAQAEVGVRTRVYSIIGSPNVMGAFLVMTAPMIAACAYYAEKLWVKCLMWGITCLLCLATLFTFSRGAWFGLTVAVVIFSLLVDRKLLAVAAVGILGVIFCVPEISNRIAFLFTSDFAAANSSGGRGERWQIGLSLWRQNRLFGFGLGRYGGAIAMQNQEIENIVYYYMDNYYLKTLTEMGLIGLISYVWLLLRNFLWSCRSVFKTQKNKMSCLISGIIAGQIGVLAHSYFENIFEVPYMNAYFWGLSAAVMYLGYLRRRKNDKA